MLIKRLTRSILPILLISLMLCSCDTGLEITSIEIGDLPDKTVYECGIDTELDLSGGTVLINTLDGNSTPAEMISDDFEIVNDIDFNTAGTYEVIISRGEFSCGFTVTVK